MTLSSPPTPFTVQWRDALRELRELRELENQHQARWRTVDAQGRRAGYVAAIEAQSWVALADEARAELEDRTRDLEQLSEVQAVATAAEPRLAALGSATDLLGAGLGRRADWAALRTELVARLTADGLSRERIERGLADVEALDDRTLSRALHPGLRAVGARIEAFAQEQLAALSGACLALALARFNAAVEHGERPVPQTDPTTIESALRRAEHDLWAALRNRELVKAHATATALTTNAAAWLMDTAVPVAAHETGTGRDAANALRASELIRALLRALALGHRLRWVLGWPAEWEPTRHWLRAAADLPFESAWTDPPVVPIVRLATEPGSSDGAAVTVEGALLELTISHRGGKALSRGLVGDAAGNAITIVLPYIKLDSGGVVPGAVVRVAGTWRVASTEASGPALQVLRKDFGDLSTVAFSDWATARLRSAYDVVPHGLAIGWSWEPGINGAGNALRYGVWHARSKGRVHARV